MANFKKNKKKTNPIIACIEKQINNAREESKAYFCISIPDSDIVFVRNYFSTKNVKVELDHQCEGEFWYKISGYDIV